MPFRRRRVWGLLPGAESEHESPARDTETEEVKTAKPERS